MSICRDYHAPAVNLVREVQSRLGAGAAADILRDTLGHFGALKVAALSRDEVGPFVARLRAAVAPHPEHQYLGLLRDLLDHGVYREGRNGGTYALFGRQMRFDLSQGFPLLTTKRVFFKAVVAELLWFLSGSTDNKVLKDQGITIWDEWDPNAERGGGDLGRVYGAQWRSWWGTDSAGYLREVDQVANLIDGLRADPYGRRHIVTAWQPAELDQMALPPCHCLFQFYVAEGRLSCQLYQRSGDVFLGVPFNIASYALLTHLIAREVGLDVGDFVHTLGDVHLYGNHVEQAREQLTREPRPFPTLEIGDVGGWWDIKTLGHNLGQIGVADYDPWPTIKAEVSA